MPSANRLGRYSVGRPQTSADARMSSGVFASFQRKNSMPFTSSCRRSTLEPMPGAISAVYPPAVSCTHSKPFQFTVSALFFIIINVTSFLFALPFSEISTDCNAPIISYFVCFVQCCEKITHIFYFSGSIARLYVHLPNVDIAGVEGFHVAVEVADNQTAVVGDPHNRRFLRVAVGHLDLHRPPRQAGAGAVFPQETALTEIRQQLFQFAQHGAEQLRPLDVTVRHSLLDGSDTAAQLRRKSGLGVADVDADADDHLFQQTGFQTCPALGQNAAELPAVQEQVIHPLDAHLCPVQIVNSTCHSDGGARRQERRIPKGQVGTEDQREIQSGTRRRTERPPLSAASGSLAVRRHYRAAAIAAFLQKLPAVGVGGVQLRKHKQLLPQCAGVQILPHRLLCQQVGIGHQPVSDALAGLNGIALLLQCTHGFPHGVAAHAQMRCQHLAGTKLTLCLCQILRCRIFYTHGSAPFSAAGMPKSRSPLRQVCSSTVCMSFPNTCAAASAV